MKVEGGCAFLPRNCLEKLGGLQEAFLMMWELPQPCSREWGLGALSPAVEPLAYSPQLLFPIRANTVPMASSPGALNSGGFPCGVTWGAPEVSEHGGQWLAPCWCAWESKRNWPKCLGPCAHMVDQYETPGFSLCFSFL